MSAAVRPVLKQFALVLTARPFHLIGAFLFKERVKSVGGAPCLYLV